MCALEHLWTTRRTNKELEREYRIIAKEKRRNRLMETQDGQVLLLAEDLRNTSTHRCYICGKNSNINQISRLPKTELCNYLRFIIDTKQSIKVPCCICATNFVNAHYLHAEEINGLTIHGEYWLHNDMKSHNPKLILPPCPTDLVTEALEYMFDLPEGAEVYVGEPEPIRIMITGRQFRTMGEIEHRMYAAGLISGGD